MTEIETKRVEELAQAMVKAECDFVSVESYEPLRVHYVMASAALAHISEAEQKREVAIRADERRKVLSELQELGEYTPPQTDEYGRVELAGYLCIGDEELDEVEKSIGDDRVCLSFDEYERLLFIAQDSLTAKEAEDGLNLPPLPGKGARD